jgi:energy-coupling factor transport system ATP-binding protein
VSLIEIRNLRYIYETGVEALKGVDLVIEKGEALAIIGQNGAGKTTLVKQLNGLLKPTSGEVVVDGWNTREYSVAKLASKVGYVFQNPDHQLFADTVRKEIAFGPTNLGFSPQRVNQLIQESAEAVGMEGLLGKNPHNLSLSQRKLVALASVLAMDTQIMVLDEPTTGQDHPGLKRIGEIINLLIKKGKTIVAISHDMDFCAETFPRIVVMARGEILLEGPAREVFGEVERLTRTHLSPPHLAQLSLRLGLARPALNMEEFVGHFMG